MKTERLKILDLLESGKITADEAARLLEALKTSAGERFWDETAAQNVEEKFAKFTENVEGFSKDVGAKLEAAFKDVEPKLRTATKVVVEKTAAIVEEISKSLSETLKNLEESKKAADNGESPCGCCDEAEEEEAEAVPEDEGPTEN
jgi:polyhydroxyalkanoate synthesis regulator phasin